MARAPINKPLKRALTDGDLVCAAIWNQDAVKNTIALPGQADELLERFREPSVRVRQKESPNRKVECDHCWNETHLLPWRWKKLDQVMRGLGYLGFCEWCGAPYEQPIPRQETRCRHDDLIETTTFGDEQRQYICRECGEHISEPDLRGHEMRAMRVFGENVIEAQIAIGNKFLPIFLNAAEQMRKAMLASSITAESAARAVGEFVRAAREI